MIHDAPVHLNFPSKGPFREPESEETSPIPGMYIPTPLAANSTPMWLLAAANDTAGMTSIGAQLAAAAKGPGEGVTGKSADPWSIFSPPPTTVRPLPRPRHRVNTAKSRAVSSSQQKLPDSKASGEKD